MGAVEYWNILGLLEIPSSSSIGMQPQTISDVSIGFRVAG